MHAVMKYSSATTLPLMSSPGVLRTSSWSERSGQRGTSCGTSPSCLEKTTIDVASQVQQFAEDLRTLFDGVFEDAPAPFIEEQADRYVIGLAAPVKLTTNGMQLAELSVKLRCCLDTSAQFIAVENSSLILTAALDRAPIIRFDYDRKAHSKPSAHIQVHAHRGALSHLLSQTGHRAPHSMESLHLPVGGPRFRPCVEDIVQFLVDDCRFDAKPGWKDVVLRGREKWRRIQVKSVVRDAPEDAAEVLRTLGYVVSPPTSGPTPDVVDKLQAW